VAVTRHLKLIMPAGNIPVPGFPLSGWNVSGGRWRPRAAGGGGRLFASAIDSVICHRRSHLPSPPFRPPHCSGLPPAAI